MIIHKPEISHQNGKVEISAQIEFEQAIANIPDRLWFRFPESCTEYLTDRGDGFLLSMLIPAMHYGEDIEVRAAVSPKLLYNLHEYQYLFTSKYSLSKVNFHCKSIQPFEPKTDPQAVLLTHSGGVDSTFALWSHLPQNQPLQSMQVTHGLLLHGFNAFDIPLENPEHFDYVYKKYDQLFTDLGLTLLYAKTNIHHFAKFRIKWGIAHGAVLSGAVHLLAGLVKTHLKGDTGGYRYRKKKPPHGESTHLLSSETMDVIYFARRYSRDEKLKALSGWEPVHTNLRVCLNWQKAPNQLNCSQCRKCFSTMVMLDLLGEYEKFTVFKQPFPHYAIRQWLGQFSTIGYNLKITFILAKQNRRYGLALLFWLLEGVRKIYFVTLKIFDRSLSNAAKYKIRKLYYNASQVADSDDHSKT